MGLKEVNAMTDKQLLVKAAELDGYTEIACFGNGIMVGSLLGGRSDEDIAKYGKSISRHDIPDYLGDIAAAWELLDSLVDGGYEPTIETHRRKDDGMKMFAIEIAVAGPGSGALYYPSTGYLDSAGRAITIAFILAMDGA